MNAAVPLEQPAKSRRSCMTRRESSMGRGGERTVDSSGRVVLDAQINVLADAEACSTMGYSSRLPFSADRS